MKHSTTLFPRAVLGLVGIGALAFLPWEPHSDDRAGGVLIGVLVSFASIVVAAAAAALERSSRNAGDTMRTNGPTG